MNQNFSRTSIVVLAFYVIAWCVSFGSASAAELDVKAAAKEWERNSKLLNNFDVSYETVYRSFGTSEVVDKSVERMVSMSPSLLIHDFQRPDQHEHRFVQNSQYQFHAQRNSGSKNFFLLDGSYLEEMDKNEAGKLSQFVVEQQLDKSFFGLLRDVLLDRLHFAEPLFEIEDSLVKVTITCVQSTQEATAGDVMTVWISPNAPYAPRRHEIVNSSGVRSVTECDAPIETEVGFIFPASTLTTYVNDIPAEEMQWKLISAKRCNVADAEFQLEHYGLSEESLTPQSNFFHRVLPLAVGCMIVAAWFVRRSRSKASAT